MFQTKLMCPLKFPRQVLKGFSSTCENCKHFKIKVVCKHLCLEYKNTCNDMLHTKYYIKDLQSNNNYYYYKYNTYSNDQ